MKKCLSAFFLCLSCLMVMGQEHICGVTIEDSKILLDRLGENQKAINYPNHIEKNGVERYIPVQFHALATDDGSGATDFGDVLLALGRLNQYFDQLEFTFFLSEDDGYNVIPSTKARDEPNSSQGQAIMFNQRNRNALNIFVPRVIGAGASGGVIAGQYIPSRDWVLVGNGFFSPEDNTLAHEVGHFFSLAHPHLGWENTPWNREDFGDVVTRTFINGIAVELVNRSNCASSADRVCDTPPDYNFGFGWNAACPPFNVDVRDRNQDLIRPHQENMMSYFNGCEFEFSNDQISLMQADYNSSRRSYLRHASMTINKEKITQSVTPFAPANAQITPFFDNVTLEWSSVENADKYWVKITGSNNYSEEFITTETTLTLTDLGTNGIYRWTVIPYNIIGSCAERFTSLFRTGNISTSTDDPSFSTEVNVFPNPVTQHSSKSITLEIDSNSSLDAILNLINTNGQIIYNQDTKILNGKNEFEISTHNLSSGIYIIKLQTKSGSVIRKLLIGE